ncbi:MAG: hypothetical protein SF070_01915 [Gemmatimonadota bacterium]|nr:hypothetical protein [Gemmatimonadota bacterium]
MRTWAWPFAVLLVAIQGCGLTRPTDPVTPELFDTVGPTLQGQAVLRVRTDNRAEFRLVGVGGAAPPTLTFRGAEVTVVAREAEWIEVRTANGLMLRFAGRLANRSAPWLLVAVNGVEYRKDARLLLGEMEYRIAEAPALRLLVTHRVAACCQ